MNEIYELIVQGIDVRQNLSQLRQIIKNDHERQNLSKIVEDEPETLCSLLGNDDAKTRKNVALLMGDLALPVFLSSLWEGYDKEEQLFVKSSYLTALKFLDYRAYMPQLKKRLDELRKTELTTENKKHVEEEMRILSELTIAIEGIQKHAFTGSDEAIECIFLTNRAHKEVTAEQISKRDESAELLPFHAGVHVKTSHLEKLLSIRTYSELLFAVKGIKSCERNPKTVATKIAASDLLPFLKRTHDGTTPFYFRIEVKSKMPLSEKSDFVKKLSSEIERETDRQLVNSTSNYEVELRLIENKEGNFNVLLRLHTIPDTRFDYRKEVVSSSMKPVNAALLVELAREYMAEDAQVLDPFCGVGTMLIERQKVVKANTSYGIDILSEAITKARINTEAAGQIVHYINKDFFDFTHEYLFDELFTNMPFQTGHTTDEMISDIYVRLFEKAPQLLRKGGRVILYSHNASLVTKLSSQYHYAILKQWEIMNREGTVLFVMEIL